MGGRGRHTRFWSTGTVSLARDAGPGFFDDQRLVLLDGTANPNILRQFVPQLQVRPEIRVRRNARVIQVRDLGAAATRGKNLQ